PSLHARPFESKGRSEEGLDPPAKENQIAQTSCCAYPASLAQSFTKGCKPNHRGPKFGRFLRVSGGIADLQDCQIALIPRAPAIMRWLEPPFRQARFTPCPAPLLRTL